MVASAKGSAWSGDHKEAALLLYSVSGFTMQSTLRLLCKGKPEFITSLMFIYASAEPVLITLYVPEYLVVVIEAGSVAKYGSHGVLDSHNIQITDEFM